MGIISGLFNFIYDILDRLKALDFTAPLLLRIFLAPIFIYAGYGKLQLGVADVSFFEMFLAKPSVVGWFGNPDWGLGLPFPNLLAFMAGWTEFLGGWFLLFGFMVRLISIPLMVTMIVAATTAHWDNGWHALPESKLTAPWEWRVDKIEEAQKRKTKAIEVLKEHGNYQWLTEHGSITVLKNGIEFAATYFLMLLALFFLGAGRFFSLDYWLSKVFRS